MKFSKPDFNIVDLLGANLKDDGWNLRIIIIPVVQIATGIMLRKKEI
jgi:hypothetical protein